MAAELTIHHRGRTTRATARGGDAQWKKLRDALLLKEFQVISEQENHLELRRRAYLLQDDWPMQVTLRREGSRFEIDCSLVVPWSWIGGLIFLALVALPFAGFRNEILMFGLLALVVALMIYKQKFDCRPDAWFWQQRPRQRWGEILERLLRDALAAER